MPTTRRVIFLAVLLLLCPFTAVLAQNENETVGFQSHNREIVCSHSPAPPIHRPLTRLYIRDRGLSLN
jgi:hypothetical protein